MIHTGWWWIYDVDYIKVLVTHELFDVGVNFFPLDESPQGLFFR